MVRTTEYLKMAGIYKVTHNNSGKVYIGKSVDMSRRIVAHKNCKVGAKKRSYFHQAIMKYGWESFSVDVLESFPNLDKAKDNEMLLQREAFYIKQYNSTDKKFGYNLCEYSNDGTGKPLSEEHKNKIRIANTGRVFPKEFGEKIRKLKLGKPFSEEHKNNLSLSKIGKKRGPHSESHKNKLREVNVGKKMSSESRYKMSQANLGKKLSDEHREKLRLSHTGVPLSEEHKEKIRNGNLGRKHSPEAIEKMRVVKRLMWENKRKLKEIQ